MEKKTICFINSGTNEFIFLCIAFCVPHIFLLQWSVQMILHRNALSVPHIMIILEYIEFLFVPGAPHLIPVNYLITPAAEQKTVSLSCLSGTSLHCFYLPFSSFAYFTWNWPVDSVSVRGKRQMGRGCSHIHLSSINTGRRSDDYFFLLRGMRN